MLLHPIYMRSLIVLVNVKMDELFTSHSLSNHPDASSVTRDAINRGKTYVQGVPSGRRLGLIVPLYAQICLGRWEFGRSGSASRQNGGTLKT